MVIRPYFNHSVDVSISTGVDAQNITTYFNDTIAKYMNLAQNTLDICVYSSTAVNVQVRDRLRVEVALRAHKMVA